MKIHEDFKKLDGIWMAELKGRPVPDSVLGAGIRSLCPVVELVFGRVGDSLTLSRRAVSNGSLTAIVAATEGQELAQISGGAEPQPLEWTRLPAKNSGYVDLNEWVAFCLRFDKSAREAGCTFDQAKTLAAAMRELTSNVHEHSNAPESVLLAYQALPGYFEFSIADSGIGVLASLRQSPVHAHLLDSQGALGALLRGASRHGAGHGDGYKKVFKVLEQCAGYVRCRSGDAAMSWETGLEPLIVQRPPLPGLVVSVGVEISA